MERTLPYCLVKLKVSLRVSQPVHGTWRPAEASKVIGITCPSDTCVFKTPHLADCPDCQEICAGDTLYSRMCGRSRHVAGNMAHQISDAARPNCRSLGDRDHWATGRLTSVQVLWTGGRQPLGGPSLGAYIAERVPRWQQVWILLVELVLEAAEGAFALDGPCQPAPGAFIGKSFGKVGHVLVPDPGCQWIDADQVRVIEIDGCLAVQLARISSRRRTAHSRTN